MTKANVERAEKMERMYRQGLTLSVIGRHFDVSRQYVQQVLKRRGVTPDDGGASLKGKMKRAEQAKVRAAIIDARWGVSVELWRECRANGLIAAYVNHRKSASLRGISFHLKFNQWLHIWQISGKLAERGRGIGKYCMPRIADAGGYEVGNVHIQLSTENGREAVKKWDKNKEHVGVFGLYPGSSRPFVAKVGRKQVGRYATQEEASAARDAYLAAHPEVVKKHVGRGYTILPESRSKRCRFQVMCGGKYVGIYATAEQALAARAAYLKPPELSEAKGG